MSTGRREVLVTSGATEALSDCMAGLIVPGDEVVLIEPLYDCYLPLVRRAGGIPRLVRLTPPDWTLDAEALAAAFGPKTKAILINNPMNPAAKVFTREELSLIAELCVAHDAIAICDEVYEHILFDGRKHIPLMTLPGMRERSRAHRLGRQDLLAHRLEGRLRHRAAASARADHQGAPVHHLHHAAEPAEGGRLRARQGRRLLCRPRRRPGERSATASPPASPGSASASRPVPAPISSPPMSRRSASTRTMPSSASA